MQTLRTIAAADWGQALERAARTAAPLAVLIAVIAADLVAFTYRAGLALGAAVHRRNDQLAALFVQVLAPDPTPAPAVDPRLAQAQRTSPHLAALREERDRLEGMTHRQLMALAGTRRKVSKRQLIAQLAAA